MLYQGALEVTNFFKEYEYSVINPLLTFPNHCMCVLLKAF